MSFTFLLKVNTIVGLWFFRVNLQQKQILHITTLLAYTEAICNLLFSLSACCCSSNPLYTPTPQVQPHVVHFYLGLRSSYLHFWFLTCTDLKDPIVPPNWVSFSDSVMDTYCLPTEMAQEQAGLLLSVLVLLVKHLMEDLLNHGVSGSTFQSQALSCSPAIYAVTCHGGEKRSPGWRPDLPAERTAFG